MLIRVLSVSLAALLAPNVSLGQDKEEHPFKKAKIGDWISYTMVTMVMGQEFKGTTKVVVTAKDETTVTLKTSATVNGVDVPAQESKIDLTKAYDPLGTTATLPKGTDVKVEKDGEGKEKIKIGNKEYDTTWMKLKVKASVKDNSFEAEVKVWLSKDVPMGGTVKMEMKSDRANMTMELKESGTGAK
jgi:hypothetical protein